MSNILELKKVNKIYGTAVKTQVLYDVDLSFPKNSFNSIIGQSGSGKSTLLNIMGTLDIPTSGEILINGSNCAGMKNNELARIRNKYMGFVFQFHYLLPEYTALENVLMPAKIANKVLSKEVEERARELLSLVGLEKVQNNNSVKMSGGQQQRTAIARALINNPEIILADEPTGNLDSNSTELVYSILRDINERFGTTFIIITHDRRIAEKADRIIEISDGRVSTDVRR